MSLKEYIEYIISQIDAYRISTVEFDICLNDYGLVVDNSPNKIKFEMYITDAIGDNI